MQCKYCKVSNDPNSARYQVCSEPPYGSKSTEAAPTKVLQNRNISNQNIPLGTCAVLVLSSKMARHTMASLAYLLTLTWVCSVSNASSGRPGVDARDFLGQTALIRAAYAGSIADVKQLILSGANVNADDTDGETSLMNAASSGHTDCVSFLLLHGAIVNARNKDGETPLMCAATYGHLDCLKVLIGHKANVNAKDKPRNEVAHGGMTALMNTSARGFADCVSLLIEHGAKIDAKDASGWTALVWAAETGHPSCAKVLLAANAKLPAAGLHYGEPDIDPGALPPAVANDHILSPADIAARALPAVVSITVRDANGSPIKSGSGFVIARNLVATNQHVVSGAHSVIVNFSDGRSVPCSGFYAEKTDCDLAIIACNTGSVVPLVLADSSTVKVGENVIAAGSPEGLSGSISVGIVSGIRVLGDRRNAKVFQTTAPISHGSSGGPLLNSYAQVVGMNSFYYASGQNLNFAYASGYIAALAQSSMAIATLWFSVPSLLDQDWSSITPDKIESLLDQGADIGELGQLGDTPIMVAVRNSSVEVVNKLISYGADVNAPAPSAFTPLMYAAMHGNVVCVNSLLAGGADVNAKDKSGETALLCVSALSWAVKPQVDTSNLAQVVRSLISSGADVNARESHFGYTPLMLASLFPSVALVDVLLSSGADLNARSITGTTALGLTSDKDIAARLRAAGAIE